MIVLVNHDLFPIEQATTRYVYKYRKYHEKLNPQAIISVSKYFEILEVFLISNVDKHCTHEQTMTSINSLLLLGQNHARS